jgi:preprotein translocase subunit SecG
MLDAIFSWDTLWWIMMVLYVPACLGLIVIVLLQQGKGSGFAGAFGTAPGGDTVFGAKSGQSATVKLTYVAAGIFMVFAVIMSVVSGKVGRGIAPELVDDASISQSASDTGETTGNATGGLTSRGLGTGVVNEDIDSGAPSPISAPSATSDESTETDATAAPDTDSSPDPQ